MPKYCSVPNCRNDSGSGSDRKSFYKFPLQDPERLRQWLRNMGRENWTPSRHQYICHEHFAASCFKVRWGIRYLESDAVPTVFQKAEKRRAADHSEKKAKVLRAISNQSITVSDDRTLAVDDMEMENRLHTVHLYEIAVGPSQDLDTNLAVSDDAKEPGRFLRSDLNHWASAGGFNGEANVMLIQSDQSDGGENTEVVVVSDFPAGDGQEELVSGLTILTQGGGLVMSDSALDCADAATLCADDTSRAAEELADEGSETQVIAYFETIPNVLAGAPSAQLLFSPDTVLSSALSSKPITSTLPIVSKHVAPSPTSLLLTVERLEAEGEHGGKAEEDGMERLDHQLEEHW